MTYKEHHSITSAALPALKDCDPWLRINDVAHLTSYSKSSIRRLVSQGQFPQPTALSPQCNVWRLSVIEGWMAMKEQQTSNNNNSFTEEA